VSACEVTYLLRLFRASRIRSRRRTHDDPGQVPGFFVPAGLQIRFRVFLCVRPRGLQGRCVLRASRICDRRDVELREAGRPTPWLTSGLNHLLRTPGHVPGFFLGAVSVVTAFRVSVIEDFRRHDGRPALRGGRGTSRKLDA
jgi:hypothetical protein